jgi:chitodextrinase
VCPWSSDRGRPPERTVPLDIKGTVPDAWNGARVRVDGNWEGSVVRVPLSTDRNSLVRLSVAPKLPLRAIRATDGQGVILADGAPLAAASKNVAVILFDFSDDTSQPYTLATAAAVAFSNGNAAANFFEEESRGAVTVTGQVFGWYTIAASHATCDPFGWAPLAESAATAAGADLSQFTNVVYAFPRVPSCAWAGLGAMPGRQSWNNGSFSLRVVAHELGHNFGVHHASSLDCTSGGVRVSLSTTCTSSEYGDPFTVMGSGSSEHDHATHLGEFGWLPTSEIQTVGPGGPYTVGSILDGPPGSKRLLRIDRSNGTWFYLDLRSVHGPYFDDFASSAPAVNGVTVRISPDAPSPAYGVRQTQLVDTTPTTATYADAPLAPGQTLTDPVSGLRITTLTAGSGSATIEVVDPVAPGSPVALRAVASSATSIDLTWTAATDNVGVHHYRVLRGGVDVGSPAGLSFTDSGLTPRTTYAYQVIAVDASTNQGTPATAAATTPPAGTDVSAPSAPRSLKARILSATARLYWTAARDDFGVTGYKVYRVGVTKPVKTVAGRSVTIKKRPGASYYVRAFDAAGNVGPRSPKRKT